MRKHIALAAAVLLAVAASPAQAGLILSLRLAGGMSRLALNDANTILKDWETWHLKEVEDNRKLALVEDKVGSIHVGVDFETEVVLGLGRHFALSVSAGVLHATLSEKSAIVTVARPTGTFSYAHTMTASAFPVFVSGYALLPLGAKFSLYAKAGAGLIWGKFVDREANKLITAEKFLYPVSQSATSRGKVLSAGAGLSFAVDDSLSFYLEAAGRKAALTDFTGETKGGIKGALYSFEQYDTKLEYWQRRFEVMEHSPEGSIFRDQGKAKIDFSGFSVKLGLALKF
jgi:opacity protein-like surface antigen